MNVSPALREVFNARHDAKTLVRVVFGRDAGDGGVGLDVLLNGLPVKRAYRPEDVNDWFAKNSKANLEAWRAAYHKSGLTITAFTAPVAVPALPTGDVLLDVPYYSQRDNKLDPLESCNVTSFAMVFEFWDVPRRSVNGKNYAQREDELNAFMTANKKSRFAHSDLVWMAQQYGLKASFSMSRTFDDIRDELRSGCPVIVSGYFTKSGHILPIIGTKGDGFIVNDPYGDGTKNYASGHRNGAKLFYPLSYMKRTAKGVGTTWAHFVAKG